MKIKNILGLSSVAALAFAASANAVTSEGIQYSLDGGAFVQLTAVTDNGVGDSNLNPNAIVHTFDLGNGLSIVISAGSTSKGTSSPIMDLGITGTLDAGHTVTIELSANGFTPPSAGSYLTHVGVVGQGSYFVTETTRIGTGNPAGNDLYAAGGTIGPIGPLGVGQQGDSSGHAPVGTGNPYAITISETISARADSTLSVDTTVNVPDGGSTMVLLGSALSVLGGFSVFRKSRKA